MTHFSITSPQTEADWQQVKLLLSELLAFENSPRPQRKDTDKIANSALRYIREKIIDHHGICLIAKDQNNQAIGFMNGWIENGDGLDQGDNRIGYISDAYIIPQCRNVFLFKKMGKMIAAHFANLGIQKLSFDTLGTNIRMQTLFIRSGFLPHKVIFEIDLSQMI